MKKRILSMLLALVMVLSMVPVQALAEATPEESVAETIAETIVEETETEATEAAEVTEATEAAETTEATEVTETTEATEATEATEVTEETEETEATEATEAVLENMDGLPAAEEDEPVEVLIIPADDSETSGVIAVDEVLQLIIDDSEFAAVKDVKWSSTNVNVATVGESTGVVRGMRVGPVYINVSCQVKVEDTDEYVKGKGKYLLSVQEPEVPKYSLQIAEDCPKEMMAGETITLTAKVLDEDGEEVISQPLLKWTLVDPKDDEYVYLKPIGSLYALPTSQHKREIAVRVSFVDDKLNLEGMELPTTTITVYPRINKIELLVDDTDEYIEDGVYYFNLNNATLCASGITVSTKLYPDGELKTDTQLIDWKVNDSRNLCYQPSTEDNESVIIKPYNMNKTGTVTVIATAKDGSGMSEKLEIRFVKLAPVVEILNAPEQMRGNSSVTLTTNVASMSGLTDRKIIWEVFDGGDGEYPTDAATISSTGKLTANRVTAPVTIKVKATAEMGGAESEYAVIEIVPAVESIEIRLPSGYESGNIPYDASPAENPLQLEAVVEPEEAIQSVDWGTSNRNIVSIDEDGNLTIKDAGKVRISAMAKDGSKRVAYIYLTITKPVNEVRFNADNPTVLRSGKSATMKATAWTVFDENGGTYVKAANQKLRWEVYEDVDDILEETTKATITSSGRLSVKDIKTNATIVVRAISKEAAPEGVYENVTEDGYAYAEYPLTIKPAKRISLLLKKDGEEITTSTIQMNADESTEIAGFWYDTDPEEGVENESPVTLNRTSFNSSNKSVATIDEFGVLETKKAGTTTITVQSRESNGTLHTAKFKLKVTNLVEELHIIAPKSTELRSGKTLTLKATAWTIFEQLKANNQKVTWSIVGEDNGPTEAATISSSGRVSAKTVTEDTIVRVIARSVENPGAEDSIELTIRPKLAYTMRLTFNNYDGENYPNEENPGAVYVPRNLSGVNPDDLRDNLNVDAYVAFDGVDGEDKVLDPMEDVVWTTSSKSIVSIDANTGALRVLKPGKVTLTAKKTLVDAKGKKTTYSASIPLVLVNAVTSIAVDVRVPGQKLYAGKTLAMRADTNPEATNKRVKWSLVGEYDDDYAVINANSGVITAKRTVKSWCQVTVQAEALDGYECESATFTVDIYPLATEVKPTLNGVSVSMTDHGSMTVKEEAVLGIEKPDNGADPEIKWTSSRTSVATIKWDKDNEVYVLVAKGKGTATIKATAQDGSGKTASFIVEVSN